MTPTPSVLPSVSLNNKPYKIVLLGDAGVGKTTYMNQIHNNYFTTSYIPTIGADLTILTFNTNIGNIKCNIWDIAGQEKFQTLDSTYEKADACIIMFDCTSMLSFKSTIYWLNRIKSFSPNIPIAICSNKIDDPYRKVSALEFSNFDYDYNCDLYKFNITCKSNSTNLVEPFMALLRSIKKNNDISYNKLVNDH